MHQELLYTNVDKQNDTPRWFAIKTRLDFRAKDILAPHCDDVFFPTENVRLPDGRTRQRAVIPHVLFVRTTARNLLTLEADARAVPPRFPLPFWIYRYPDHTDPQVIPPTAIHLLRLLTTDDTTRCRIYTPADFRPSQRVRVTGGIYAGYTGYVRRIARNRHVIVSIEGLCMVILPFIHPDLLEPLE